MAARAPERPLPLLRSYPALRSAPDSFTEWLARADTIMLACRVFAHHWPDIMDRRTRVARERSGSYVVESYCLRAGEGCGTRRVQHLESDGQLATATSVYTYPAGYLFRGDDGATMDRKLRGLVRLELIRRKAMGDM